MTHGYDALSTYKQVSCPNCGKALATIPTRTAKCTLCKKPIIIRTDRTTKAKIYLTEAHGHDFDLKRKAQAARNKALRLTQDIGLSVAHFTAKEKQLSLHGPTPTPHDIFWSLANDALKLYSQQGKWQDLKMVYWTLARLQFENNQPHLDFLRAAATAELQHLRSVDIVKGARIAAGQACELCRRNNGRVYTIEEALREMPIPNPNCQNVWCRCVWMAEIGETGGSGHGY